MAGTTWQCAACDTYNDAQQVRCMVCDERRAPDPPSPVAPPGPPQWNTDRPAPGDGRTPPGPAGPPGFASGPVPPTRPVRPAGPGYPGRPAGPGYPAGPGGTPYGGRPGGAHGGRPVPPSGMPPRPGTPGRTGAAYPPFSGPPRTAHRPGPPGGASPASSGPAGMGYPPSAAWPYPLTPTGPANPTGLTGAFGRPPGHMAPYVPPGMPLRPPGTMPVVPARSGLTFGGCLAIGAACFAGLLIILMVLAFLSSL
ncbi:hypothetical protein Skr01_04280 [Sphaerisporangium krabiense]|uniref:RanBP2-type domain-containing protein n=1 Tax=Sphaerisporangium krabiense TaxID=763782 RepID=A0A7W8Z7Q7_9ACTN|nr:hypothetical protein [Sphaerisporangium krabiense]MBB5628815.1 hypothetical protein [Sphaerisporangium krabiense]GII60343.1 hypothetical protein Skr01_04280 [Sphaerisporangium krabiense]